MRINKYLSDAGVCSRREADRLIEAGKVTLRGRAARLGDVVAEGDIVEVSGRRVTPPEKRTTIAFHKPVGVITTTDPRSKDNILEALAAASHRPPSIRLIPVGRLDVATSGLLLMTDDLGLADRLMRPESGIEKEYDVVADKPLTEEFLERMATGVTILDGYRTRPAVVRRIDEARFSIVITEGKNRQIRRMCEALGYGIRRLSRTRIGGVRLEQLPAGEWRMLTPKELASLSSEPAAA